MAAGKLIRFPRSLVPPWLRPPPRCPHPGTGGFRPSQAQRKMPRPRPHYEAAIKNERPNDDGASGRKPLGNPMPRTEVEEHYAELTREIDALEAELPNSQARGHIADVRRRIETLYETLRANRRLLETILENSAANIYAKRKDGRYIYLNHEMEITCGVTRQQAIGKTDLELVPTE